MSLLKEWKGVFQLKHLNKTPRQSRQCCQQVEGKVPSHGETPGAQKNLDKILQPDLSGLPNSGLSSNDKDILQQNSLPFVYRNKQEQLKANNLRSLVCRKRRNLPFHTLSLNMIKRRNISHGETQDIPDRCSNSTGLPIPPKWSEIPQNQDSCDS